MSVTDIFLIDLLICSQQIAEFQPTMFSKVFGKPKQETNPLATLEKLNEVQLRYDDHVNLFYCSIYLVHIMWFIRINVFFEQPRIRCAMLVNLCGDLIILCGLHQ